MDGSTGSSPTSYVGAAPSGTGISELMPGVRNLLDYVDLRHGEDVLILLEHGVDGQVVEAIAAGAAYRGAKVHLLAVPPFSPGGWDREVPSPIVAAACQQVDAVISLTWWAEVHSRPLFFTEIPRHRARFVSLHMTATAAALASGARFPPEVFYAIKRAALDRCVGASEIRVLTGAGTDVTFRDLVFDTDAGPLEPGMWRPFPLGGLNFYPGRTDGRLAIEESTVTGIPASPLVVELRDGIVTDLVGGAEAEHLRRFSPGGYYLRHAFVGLNPKVRLAGGTQFEREKHAGAFYLGLDGLTDGRPDRSGPGYAHCDCQFDRPTVLVDGRPLIEEGRLLILDDAAVRKAAARFGPPDAILDDNPRLVLAPRHSLVP